jgi:hypothetical protein
MWIFLGRALVIFIVSLFFVGGIEFFRQLKGWRNASNATNGEGEITSPLKSLYLVRQRVHNE